jgi:anti-anti-sigma factor
VIDDQGSLFVRVDLSGVTFIDSTGLSLLVDALQRVRDKGGTLTLSHPAPSVRRVFGIVGFPRLFDITPERNESAPSAGTAPAVGTVARRDHRSSSGTDAV